VPVDLKRQGRAEEHIALFPPATPEETPALYRAQMALYRAALAKIYPGRRIACALVWTEQPRLMTLPAELLDAEIARIAARRIG